ncbi:MAG TPA: hypothetical protein VFM82_10385 [Flavobacteriaceae bacterium]|nr:hypothetical protein [Flavobacteriaceae bacterium]
MKRALLLIVILLPSFGFGQSGFCDKSYGDSYYPLKIGFQKTLTWGNSIYTEKVTGTTTKNGIVYFNYEQDFGGGTSYNLLLRKQHDTVFMYNEKHKKDVILLIERPVKGTKWESGKVIDTDGFFDSPFCNYKNLLVIENKYSDRDKEKRFYKKGLGLVAVTTKGGIKGMCVPSKEEEKEMMEPFAAFGCEDLEDKDAIAQCTLAFIHTFLTDRLSKQELKLPKEEGVLKFKLYFDATGKIVKIDRLNSIGGGRQVQKAIEKILLSLPKFKPLKTSENKTIGTKVNIAIPIKTK